MVNRVAWWQRIAHGAGVALAILMLTAATNPAAATGPAPAAHHAS